MKGTAKGFLFFLALVPAALLYLPNLHSTFLQDDFSLSFFLNEQGEIDSSKLSFLLYPKEWKTTFPRWRPVPSLLTLMDFTFFRTNPFGYHLSNLILHFLTCAILFTISGHFLKRRSYFALLLFSLNPWALEPVCWISGRQDLACAFFTSLSLLCYLGFLQNPGKKKGKLAGSLLFFFFALGSKELSVCLPFLLLPLLLFRPGNKERASLAKWLSIFPFFFVLAAYFAFRAFLFGTPVGEAGGLQESTTQFSLDSFTAFLQRFPSVLFKILYPINEEVAPPGMRVAAAAGIFTCLAVPLLYGLFTLRKGLNRLVLLLLVWFILIILPEFPLFWLKPNLSGGRLLYLPAVPLCLLFTLLLFPRKTRIPIPRVVMALRLLLPFLYAWILHVNVSAYTEAGEQAMKIRRELAKESGKHPPGTPFLLWNIPKDHKGAPLFASGLAISLSPPFFRERLSIHMMRENVSPPLTQMFHGLKGRGLRPTPMVWRPDIERFEYFPPRWEAYLGAITLEAPKESSPFSPASERFLIRYTGAFHSLRILIQPESEAQQTLSIRRFTREGRGPRYSFSIPPPSKEREAGLAGKRVSWRVELFCEIGGARILLARSPESSFVLRKAPQRE